MYRMCKIILGDAMSKKIASSRVSIQFSTILPEILNPKLVASMGFDKDVIAGNEVVYNKRELHHFLNPSKSLLFGQSAFSQTINIERLRSVSQLNSLDNNHSTMHQNYSISRNYSTTSRMFSATAVASSVSPSAQTASVIVDSSSSTAMLMLPDFFTIYGAEKAFQYIHQLTGLPWWSIIVLTAFILRGVLLVPLTVHSFHNVAKLQHLQTEIKEKAVRLRTEVSMAMSQFQWDQKRAKLEYDKNFKRLLKEMYIRDNCHPMKGVAIFWVQMPIWLSVTYALRNLSLRAVHPEFDGHLKVNDLAEQGLAWFPDLTVADGTWLLPIMMGAVTLFNTEMHYLNLPEVTKYRKRITYALRGVALVFIPISAAMPSSMVLYWVSSAIFASVNNLLFEYSPFRRLVGLPKSDTESQSPLRALRQKAKARYWKR